MQKQSSQNGWSEGCKLWIVPHRSHSAWTKKLDWILNFQITKTENFQRQDLNSEFLTLIGGLGMKLDWVEESINPVHLVLTRNVLPCDALAVMPAKGGVNGILNHWLRTIEGFKRPQTRVFPVDDGAQQWPTQKDALSVLPDEVLSCIQWIESKP